jgi:hypothetical protein
MDRSTLKALAVAVAGLMVVVLVAGLMSGGMSSGTRSVARATLAEHDTARESVARSTELVHAALEDHARLFSDARREAWTQRLRDAEQRLAAADEAAAKARALLDENDEEKEADLVREVEELRTASTAARLELEEMAQAAEQRIRFATDRPALLAQLEEHHARVQSVDVAGLAGTVEEAATRWPDKAGELTGLLNTVREAVTTSDQLLATAQSENETFARDPTAADLDAFFLAARRLAALAQRAPQLAHEAREDIAQLDVSWDDILVDMEIVESGSSNQFFHSIKRVTTPANVPEGETATPTEQTRRVAVDRREFERHQSDLGMVLRHKDAGKFESEAEETTQPPGYAYMAPPGQRNRYGYWENRSGSNFWVWYGQYSLMRNLFYGPRYIGVPASSWTDYDRSRRMGRTFYGTTDAGKPRWGSSSTFSGSRYASSSYKRNDGYTGNRWRSSGGSFRSSPYSTSRSASRSTGRGSYRSFRSGGSRSFGGK